MRVCPHCFALYGPENESCPKDGQATQKFEDVLIGRTLGPYIVKSILGEGGMGVVYSGEHPTIGRKVALKVLRPELSLRDNIVDQFVQEARSVNTIGHANIVNIYDFGKTPFGSFYIVMEYLNGQTLRTLLDAEGPQPLSRVRSLVRGVGAALSAAHAKGYIHRDVKPENIMLVQRRGKEFVKLLDFGIVKLLTDPSGKTQIGGALGTPQYMSPEQLDLKPLDHRTDIYSLSIVAYEALTGKLPYDGQSDSEVRQQQLTRTPPPPSVCRKEETLSRKLDAAIFWALSLDPANRCATVVDFLTGFEDGYQSTLSGDPGPGARPARGGRSRVAIAVVLGLLAVACGVIIALVIQSQARQPDPAPRAGVVHKPDASPAQTPDAGTSTAELLAVAQAKVLEGLRSEDVEVRREAVTLLGRLKRPLLTNQLLGALADADLSVRRAAAQTLAQMGHKDAIPALARAHKESMGFMAIYYATALAQLGHAGGTTYLKKQLKSPKNTFQKKAVLRALGKLGHPSARAWKEFLGGSNVVSAELRIEGQGYLAALGDKQAIAWLKQAIREKGWPARILAAEALAAVDPDHVKPVLRQALTRAPAPQRVAAAARLAHFGDATSFKTLVEFADARNIEQRVQCTLALGYLPGVRTKTTLSRGLRDSNRRVAMAAAVAFLRQRYRISK